MFLDVVRVRASLCDVVPGRDLDVAVERVAA